MLCKKCEIVRCEKCNEVIENETKLKYSFYDQYKKRIETLNFFGLNDIRFPYYETVIKSFTKEELELAKTFQEPTLLLIPECSFQRKIEAINNHKTMPNQKDCYVDEIYNPPKENNAISCYRAMIAEGAKEMNMKEGDNLNFILLDRIQDRKANRKTYEKGMDRNSYAILMMEALKKGDPIDVNGWTLLDNDEANSMACVPFALWGYGNDRVRFSADDSFEQFDGALFRSSVGGDKLL